MRTHPDGLKHIRSRKDVVEVRAHPSCGESGAATADAAAGVVAPSSEPTVGQMAHMHCPISQMPYLKNRVALLVPCGHSFCYR